MKEELTFESSYPEILLVSKVLMDSNLDIQCQSRTATQLKTSSWKTENLCLYFFFNDSGSHTLPSVFLWDTKVKDRAMSSSASFLEEQTDGNELLTAVVNCDTSVAC